VRIQNYMGVYKALLLAGCAGTFAVAAPAMAQNTPPASADCDVDPLNPACAAPDDGSRIVVTGSRIQRQDYNSTTPMVTADEALLDNSSTAAIESNLNRLPQFVPAQTPTAGGDIQPTATNTPGAATVSLRGLGANRNLVLLDGRRATPSNASGAVDINTIPSAAIERVEIISGGASATYGADAVAGVTNFILKKNFQGIELDGQLGISQQGDGFEYQISGIMGSDFDGGRGNVSIAMSVNTREKSLQANRSWYQDLWANPNIGTNRFFPLYPGIALGSGNPVNSNVFYNQLFPGTQAANQANGQPFPNTIAQTNTSVYLIPGTSTLFTTGYTSRGGVPFFANAANQGLQQGDLAVVRANGALNFVDRTPYLFLPLTRYNMFFRGNYELNDWISIFGQGLYSNTETHTTQQGGAITSGWDGFIPYGTGVYTGSAIPTSAYGSSGIPSSVILNGMLTTGAISGNSGTVYTDLTPGNLADNPTNPQFTSRFGKLLPCANSAFGGCTNNQAIGQFLPPVIQTLLNNRTNPNARAEVNFGFPENRSVTNDVATYNMIAGFEGKVPTTDWTWEAFVNHGVTDTYTLQTGVLSLDRVRTLLMAPGFGQGYVGASNDASVRNEFGAVTGTCTSGMNIFVLPWDQVSQDCKDAIAAPLKNNQRVTQTIVEANAQGSLLALPAGSLRAAIGASYRKLKFDFVNDTITEQGGSFLDQTIGIYPSKDVHAGYAVRELYGELLVPVLKDIPFIQEFNLELGARYSDYNTTGGSWTYKILGDWEINNWLRLRGGYNRASRAPNAAELFLAPSEIFGGAGGPDLCSQRALGTGASHSANAGAPGNTAGNAADVQAVCRIIMDNTGGPGTGAQYYDQRPLSQQPQAAGFAFTQAVGNANLKPETADTWTAGLVVQSPFTTPWLSRLRFSVDWWKIHVSDAIGLQSQLIKPQQCLDPNFNPGVTGAAGNLAQAAAAANAAICQGVRYNPNPALGTGTFDVTYTNSGEVSLMGIDGQLDWSAPIGPGKLSLNVLVNYYLNYKSRLLPTDPLIDYAGTIGTSQNGLNPGAFRYRVLTTVGYNVGPARISLQWQHLPSALQEAAATATGLNQAYIITGYPAYDLFNLDVNYNLTDKVSVRAGVDNLFNRAPPIGGVNTTANLALGQLPGGGFNSAFYDVNGRRFFVGANIQF
jgi:iron complex outermembrane receptor protein